MTTKKYFYVAIVAWDGPDIAPIKWYKIDNGQKNKDNKKVFWIINDHLQSLEHSEHGPLIEAYWIDYNIEDIQADLEEGHTVPSTFLTYDDLKDYITKAFYVDLHLD